MLLLAAVCAHAAPQAAPFLGRYSGEEVAANGRRTVGFVLRERGDAIVRTNFPGQRETAVETARWESGGGRNRFTVTTEKGDRFDVQYLRGDTLRVTRLTPAPGRRPAPFTAYKVQVDQFMGRYVGTRRGAGGPIEAVFNIKGEDDVNVRLTYNRAGSQPVVERGRLEGAGRAGRVRVLVDGADKEYLLDRRSTDSLTVTEVERGRQLRPYVVSRQDQQAWDGVYVFGAGTSSFRPCRTQEFYELRGEQALLSRIEREYRRVATRPYQPVYVRLRGDLAAGARAAGADYDGVFAATRLDELRARRPGDCAGASNPTSVTGTVTYRERMAVPRGATLEVRLVDVSRQDAAGRVVAEQTIRNVSSVPVRFDLRYDPLEINPRRTYAVEAQLSVGGQVMFRTTTRYAVITQGNPRTAEVLLTRQ